jgi:putative transposase
MRPDPSTTEAFLYCLALAARRFNIGIIAFIANSNHWHGVVIDHDGRLPEFLHFFHAMFAKHQNCLRGRWENFWASEQTSVVELDGLEDIVAKTVYTICNPVKDNLVERCHDWPGASAYHAMVKSHRVSAKRPKRFFDKQGCLPDTAEIILEYPDGTSNLDEFQNMLSVLIDNEEASARARRRNDGTTVIGRRRILNQHWDSRPHSRETRRNMSPRLACRNRWARVERLCQNKAWLESYYESLNRWKMGHPEVVFPAGTYALRRFANVPCASHSLAMVPDNPARLRPVQSIGRVPRAPSP